MQKTMIAFGDSGCGFFVRTQHPVYVLTVVPFFLANRNVLIVHGEMEAVKRTCAVTGRLAANETMRWRKCRFWNCATYRCDRENDNFWGICCREKGGTNARASGLGCANCQHQHFGCGNFSWWCFLAATAASVGENDSHLPKIVVVVGPFLHGGTGICSRPSHSQWDPGLQSQVDRAVFN